jgi:hypothetical protein
MIMARWPDAFSTDFVGAPTKIARFLMPARYVRPYSKGQKNDFRDAEAIAEAVQRPTMKFVATKTVDQLDLQGKDCASCAPSIKAVDLYCADDALRQEGTSRPEHSANRGSAL